MVLSQVERNRRYRAKQPAKEDGRRADSKRHLVPIGGVNLFEDQFNVIWDRAHASGSSFAKALREALDKGLAE